MKQLFLSVFTTGILMLTACNNGENKTTKQEHDMSKMNPDTAQHAAATDVKEIKTITVTYNQIDQKAAASIKEIVAQYLRIKNALANDQAGEAAEGGKAMEAAMNKLDKSLFTTEQKKVYDEFEPGLIEDAEHIGKNGDKISHQREHFASMSTEVYDLVKAFGAGQPIYHDHCPMYNENKGAMWLSEIKEVKNPYFGAEMPTCGTVEEVIQ